MGGSWPNLFVVGAPRCATTALWSWLDRHPEISMSRPKEPQFCSGLVTSVSVLDEDAYLALFAGMRTRYRGEASTSYLSTPEVPARIHAVAPDARIIVSLRDPVARAVSSYLFHRQRGWERRSLEDVLEAELSDDASGASEGRYLGPSRYADGLERYFAFYGRERVHVLIFEELRARPRQALEELLDFLGVDPEGASSDDLFPMNRSAPPRNALVGAAVRSKTLRRVAEVVVPPGQRKHLMRAVLVERRHPPLLPTLQRRLERVFAGDVARTRVLLGRELPWPTGQAAVAPPSS